MDWALPFAIFAEQEVDFMRVTKKIRDEQLAILEETYRGAKPELIFRNPF